MLAIASRYTEKKLTSPQSNHTLLSGAIQPASCMSLWQGNAVSQQATASSSQKAAASCISCFQWATCRKLEQCASPGPKKCIPCPPSLGNHTSWMQWTIKVKDQFGTQGATIQTPQGIQMQASHDLLSSALLVICTFWTRPAVGGLDFDLDSPQSAQMQAPVWTLLEQNTPSCPWPPAQRQPPPCYPSHPGRLQSLGRLVRPRPTGPGESCNPGCGPHLRL